MLHASDHTLAVLGVEASMRVIHLHLLGVEASMRVTICMPLGCPLSHRVLPSIILQR
jgi:hypothetical protein